MSSVMIPQDFQKMILEVINNQSGSINYVDAVFEDLDRLPEPERTAAIKEWLNAPPSKMTVKLVTNDGKPMSVNWRGDEIYISASGRRLDRTTASYLIRRFGVNGKYRGKHQASGFNHTEWRKLVRKDPEEAQYLLKLYPDLETAFASRYIMQERIENAPKLSEMLNVIESQRDPENQTDDSEIEEVH